MFTIYLFRFTVDLGCATHMRLEESVEEGYIVKPKRHCNLLDLHGRQFQLRFGIRQDGFVDDVTRGFATNRFDGATQVRQRDVHCIRIFGDMVPLHVVLQN